MTGVPQQPDDRLDLSELKSAAERGVTSLKSGQYISLPLDGRVDLMMSRPKPKAISLPPRHASPTAISPPALNAPSPQTFQQQMTQPATWDGSRSAPPPTSGPEMLTPMTQRYAAAWDQPASAQSKYYSSQQTEPEYPNVPENVRGNDWYRGFAGSTPDRNNVLPVFPWEETPQHRRPDRVFPQGASSPSQNRSTGPSPQRNAEAKSMQEAIASYTNAWDQMPSIRQYVMRITGTGQHSSERDLAVMGLQSVPGTPRFESSMGRELSADRQSNISGDGDDEDDDEEGTVETETSPSVGHSRDSTFELPLDLPANARHRARQAQLARIPPPEAGLNIRNTPVVIGEVPKPERKVIARQSSSSDTPRTTPNLVTPPSDSARISGQAQYTSDSPEPRASRIWDPSTDVDVRKRDTQNVLSRFMKVGGMPGGSGGK